MARKTTTHTPSELEEQATRILENAPAPEPDVAATKEAAAQALMLDRLLAAVGGLVSDMKTTRSELAALKQPKAGRSHVVNADSEAIEHEGPQVPVADRRHQAPDADGNPVTSYSQEGYGAQQSTARATRAPDSNAVEYGGPDGKTRREIGVAWTVRSEDGNFQRMTVQLRLPPSVIKDAKDAQGNPVKVAEFVLFPRNRN